MNRLILILILLCAFTASAVDRITVSVNITNATTNGQTFVLNGSTRMFTNSVQNPATQVLTNSTAAGSKTNLFQQIGGTPFSQVSILDVGSTNFTLAGASGLAMTASITAGIGYVTYSTQQVSVLTTVRVPYSAEFVNQRTNIASGISAMIEGVENTNSINQNSFAVSELMGVGNTQYISGVKYLTNSLGDWRGGVTNSPGISGTIANVTNGMWWAATISSGTLSNVTLWGNNVISGAIDISGTLGFDGNASYISAEADYFVMQPESSHAVVIGNFTAAGGVANGINAHQVYATNNIISGATLTASNAVVTGGVTLRGTNSFPAGSDISFGRYANTSLANGNNAGVVVGTNTFVQVSGPSAAFTICGMTSSPNRDGKYVIVVNRTGQNLTIANDSGVDPTAGNRIYTTTGADMTSSGNCTVTLIYNGNDSRWNVITFQD